MHELPAYALEKASKMAERLRNACDLIAFGYVLWLVYCGIPCENPHALDFNNRGC